MTNLSAHAVKQYAHTLGFDLCGIAAAGSTQTHSRYTDWLAHGYHAQMDYLARPDAVARRANPREILPEAQSIVVVAMNYYAMPPLYPPCQQGGSHAGRVVRYAWGPDYHQVIAGKLEQLAKWIETEAGQSLTHKVCVDTSAMLEREWAVRAGLGWIGKNACLINPHFGSWLLLGELLLDVELEPDSPFQADRCGTCTRCIEACPTACLLPERTLDANRCISYLTIESRGEIPTELEKEIGDWIFGCDVCQDVCPWNRFARPSALTINPDWVSLDPAEILAMDEAAFRKRFAGSAIKRAKLAGMVRNAQVLIANTMHK